MQAVGRAIKKACNKYAVRTKKGNWHYSSCLFCLDKVLTIKNQQESKYILHGYNYEYSCEISFGRNRKKMVPEQCYIVTTKEDEYELEKIEFNEEGKCNYLDVLKKKNSKK